MNSQLTANNAEADEPKSTSKFGWQMAVGLVVAFSCIGLGAARWYQLEPPWQKHSSALSGPVGILVVADRQSSANQLPANANNSSSSEPLPTRPAVQVTVQPMDEFREALRKQLVQQVAPVYPQMPEMDNEKAKGTDTAYRDSVFQFLSAAEKAPAAQQPAMLLAADFILINVWCPSPTAAEPKDKCDQLRSQFAAQKLTFQYAELDGGSFYQRDLLWRIWQDFPTTDWGERAFVLLLDSGWDTSGTCSKGGADQFRQVISQGETFLQQHPNSENRAFVTHLVAQAYATWWTLSKTPARGMEDYVDSSQYAEGSEAARLKAIDDFEQVQQLAPGTPLAEYAQQVLPALREQQTTTDGYRFFCVYD